MSQRKVIYTEQAADPVGPYQQANQVTECKSLLFVSGQVPLDATTGKLVSDDVQEQTKQVMENLKAVLEKGSSSIDQLVKTTIFIQNMEDFPKINEIYGSYLPEGQEPARSCVEVAKLPKGAQVEIEAVALVA